MKSTIVVALVSIPIILLYVWVFIKIRKITKNTKVLSYEEIGEIRGYNDYDCPKCKKRMESLLLAEHLGTRSMSRGRQRKRADACECG